MRLTVFEASAGHEKQDMHTFRYCSHVMKMFPQ